MVHKTETTTKAKHFIVVEESSLKTQNVPFRNSDLSNLQKKEAMTTKKLALLVDDPISVSVKVKSIYSNVLGHIFHSPILQNKHKNMHTKNFIYVVAITTSLLR